MSFEHLSLGDFVNINPKLIISRKEYILMKKHLYAVVGVNEKTSNENPFAISEEEALANLEAFLAGSEEAETRGLSVKSVSSIVPVNRKKPLLS